MNIREHLAVLGGIFLMCMRQRHDFLSKMLLLWFQRVFLFEDVPAPQGVGFSLISFIFQNLFWHFIGIPHWRQSPDS